MFGRKKKPVDDFEDEDIETSPEADDDIDDADVDDAEDDDAVDDDAEDDDEEAAGDDESDDEDEWERLDESRDWREDGPFDITEVDLDADRVQRLDFGSLVVTPFDGMKLQMQVNQASGKVQALLVMDKQSAIEIALFAAPAKGSMLAQVRDEMRVATEKAGGKMTLAKGPLGVEVRRVLKVKASDGREGKQLSRTWMVQGPKWLLRGVMMGKGAIGDQMPDDAELLYEFFCNLVVRRGDTPRVPGELIGLDVPSGIGASLDADSAK